MMGKFVLLLFSFIAFNSHANNIDSLFLKAQGLIKSDPEKSVKLIMDYSIAANESESVFYKGKAHYLLGEYGYITGNLEMSSRSFRKALANFSEIQRTDYIAKTLSRIGSVFLAIQDFEKSEHFTYKAMDLYESLNDSLGVADMYFNLANLKTNLEELDSAFFYYELSQKYYEQIGEDTEVARSLLMKSYLHFFVGEIDQAKSDCEMSLRLNQELEDQLAIQSSLYVLALIYQAENNFTLARDCLLKAELLTEHVENLHVHADILILESEIYKELGQNDLAHSKLSEGSLLRDSLNEPTKIHYIEGLYDRFTSVSSNKLVGNPEIQRNWIYYLAGIFLFFSLLSIYLIKKRRNSLSENKSLTEEISRKNQELVSKTIKITQQQQLLESIEERLGKISSDNENNGELMNILSSLKTGYTPDLWEEFESHFTGVHKNFYINLNKSGYNLTANERRLAALICLNLNSKEVAQITGKSTRSIDVARYRMRKKMKLSREDSLISALTEFM